MTHATSVSETAREAGASVLREVGAASPPPTAASAPTLLPRVDFSAFQSGLDAVLSGLRAAGLSGDDEFDISDGESDDIMKPIVGAGGAGGKQKGPRDAPGQKAGASAASAAAASKSAANAGPSGPTGGATAPASKSVSFGASTTRIIPSISSSSGAIPAAPAAGLAARGGPSQAPLPSMTPAARPKIASTAFSGLVVERGTVPIAPAAAAREAEERKRGEEEEEAKPVSRFLMERHRR